MSQHYSRYLLNTYSATPYFRANIPSDYPLDGVLTACRSFRKLPANLRKLAGLAKQWASRVYPVSDYDQANGRFDGIDRWYDDAGNELDQATGQPMTDQEIEAQWANYGPPDATLATQDISIPADGFPDPDTWEPQPVTEASQPDDGLTEEQVLSDISSRGIDATARAYGVQPEELDGVKSVKDAVRLILEKHAASQVT